MTIPVIALCIGVIIFLFAVGMLWWLGSSPTCANVKFAWWPHKLSERATDAIWYDTSRWVWLEYVGVHKTPWGADLYYRLR